MSASSRPLPNPRRAFARWLALALALLQPLALAPAALAAGSSCSERCCCAAAAEPRPDAEEGGCCAAKAAREERGAAQLRGECDCRLRSSDDAPEPERAPTPGASATEGACERHERGAAVSARSPLAGVCAGVPALAHGPPARASGEPPGASGPWTSLAQRGVDARLAGLGLARL